MVAQSEHLHILEGSQSSLCSLRLPVEIVWFLLMHIHGHGVSGVCREGIVVHTDFARLREIDGVGARIIGSRIKILWLFSMHQDHRTAVLAGDGSQHGSCPCTGWQGIRIIDLTGGLIYIKFIAGARHVRLEQGILSGSSLCISVEVTEREAGDGRIVCIFHSCIVAAQAR